MTTSSLLHWLHESYITAVSWEKSTAYLSSNITKYGNSWFDGSALYNQSAFDYLHADNNLPVTSAAHLGLVTGLLLAVLLNSRLNTIKGIDWQYWLETMGMNIMFAILCLMFTLATLPIVGVFLAIFFCYRKCIELYLKNTRSQFISLLEGLDAIWALEDDASLSVINILAIVEVQDIVSGNELLESFRRAIVSNFATPPFPCPKLFYFRQKCLGYFYWEQQHQLRIENHIRWMKEVETDKTNGLAEDTLKGMVAELSNSKLPADHAACWEILISRQHLVKQSSFQASDVFQAMEEGFPDISSTSILRYPVLFRIHHSLGDGIALMKLLITGLADKIQITEDLRSRTPSPIPTLVTTCDFTSTSTDSSPNSGRASPVFCKTTNVPLKSVTSVKAKDLNLPQKTPRLYHLRKSELVLELENLSDQQDREGNNSSIYAPSSVQENSNSQICKEALVQNTSPSVQTCSPFLTPSQPTSPPPVDQYSHPSSPLFFNSRCLSPESNFHYHNAYVKEIRRSSSPLLLTTRSHSPIIGKAVLKSPCCKYNTNTSQPLSYSRKAVPLKNRKSMEDFFNTSRCTSPFSLSRPVSPYATSALVRSQSVSPPPSSIYREDSPHIRNATSVQCYQRNTCNCFNSIPHIDEHVGYKSRNTTTIYYYNKSGTNSGINNMKGRETSCDIDNKIFPENSTNAMTIYESKICPVKSTTFSDTENCSGRNGAPISKKNANNIKDHEIPQAKMPVNNSITENHPSNKTILFPREDNRFLMEKTMSRASNVGSNTEITKCVSTSTQTSPLKSLPNTASMKLSTVNSKEQNASKNGKNIRKSEIVKRSVLKTQMTVTATLDANHSNPYVKKAVPLTLCAPRNNFHSDKTNIRSNSAITEISLGATDDNVSYSMHQFNWLKFITEIWNHFSSHKNEQKICKPNSYTPPSTPNPYIQLLNAISETSNKYKRITAFAHTVGALIFAPATLINQALMRAADNNALHGPSLSGYKVVAWYVDYSGELLECVKRVKDCCGTHFTDVILTGLSASLDTYFSTHPASCGTVPQSVTIVVPARMEAPEPIRFAQNYDVDCFNQFSNSSWGTIQLSTENEENNIALNNRFSVALLTLPLNGQQNIALSPRDRLYEVYHHSKQLRNSPDYLVNYWLLRVVAALLPASLLGAVVRSSQSTLVVSNMKGPESRLSMAGSQLRDIFFWVPHRGATGIGITILSYMDRLQLGIMADRALVTCQQDAQLILNRTVSEIKNLEHMTVAQ